MKDNTELRRGYSRLVEWLEKGMIPQASIHFTEGDCRIAGQLMEMTKSHFLNNLISHRETMKVSLCPHCHCMTKTILKSLNFKVDKELQKYLILRCGKCGGRK